MNSVSVPYADRLLASQAINPDQPPLITVAIPHYARRRYLEVVLASLFDQDFLDFEIVISDDQSPDDSRAVIPALLQQSRRAFRYYVQPINLRYDRNLRFCLSAALGHYVFLLGNDDALNDVGTLRHVAEALRQLDLPQVAYTNFANWSTGTITRRASDTRSVKPGIDTATAHFSAFAFVSGLIFERVAAQLHATERWDGSSFYQIYLASRLIAAGGRLATLDLCAVRQEVQIESQVSPEYLAQFSDARWSLQPRNANLPGVIELTVDAVLPYSSAQTRSAAARRIASDVLHKSYLFWLLEYRRVANWGYAFGLARGLWPRGWLATLGALNMRDRIQLWLQYLGLTVVGLLTPRLVFDVARQLRRRLKRAR